MLGRCQVLSLASQFRALPASEKDSSWTLQPPLPCAATAVLIPLHGPISSKCLTPATPEEPFPPAPPGPPWSASGVMAIRGAAPSPQRCPEDSDLEHISQKEVTCLLISFNRGFDKGTGYTWWRRHRRARQSRAGSCYNPWGWRDRRHGGVTDAQKPAG